MSAHLSAEQLKQITVQLKERFANLQNEVHEHLMNANDEKYAEIAGQVHDRGDESVADLLADLNYTVIDNHVKEMQTIEKTLFNISKKDYGQCVDCGVDIPFARLKVTPTATRCVDCQQSYEDKFQRGAQG